MYDTILFPKTQDDIPAPGKTGNSAKTASPARPRGAGMHKNRRIAPKEGACYNKMNFCILW